jgi:hypothetical protein
MKVLSYIYILNCNLFQPHILLFYTLLSMRLVDVLGDLIDLRTPLVVSHQWIVVRDVRRFSGQSAQKQLDRFWKAARPVFTDWLRVDWFRDPIARVNSGAGRQV